MKILVTGASGFIGSHFVKMLLNETDHSVVAFMRYNDQRNNRRVVLSAETGIAKKLDRVRFVHGDLLGDISGLTEGCDVVVNFAAKTFVDHSIRDPWPFIEANVVGTYRILEDARKNGVKKFIQISTDEVYGAILEGAYKEDARINPTNPYAAAKAGADALVISYAHAFGMWTAITRTENNYGPFQHPQKVFPAFVRALLKGQRLPIYGDGKHRRQWLWVEDHCSAVLMLVEDENVKSGQIFHVAGSQELENLELAKRIINAFDLRMQMGQPGLHKPGETLDPQVRDSWADKVRFLDDHNVRPGHDRRYALVCDKMKMLGWVPEMPLEAGIWRAVNWYIDNAWWLQ